MDVPLSVVQERDPKGLYKKVAAGELKGGSQSKQLITFSLFLYFYIFMYIYIYIYIYIFTYIYIYISYTSDNHKLCLLGFTGVDDPYEPPLHAEINMKNDGMTVQQSVDQIMHALRREGVSIIFPFVLYLTQCQINCLYRINI
jgi:hypothetical protein